MAEKKVVFGLDRKTAAALAYFGFWPTGLIVFLLVKEDRFVRFHALQSIIVFGLINILMMLPFIGFILNPILKIILFIVWLICIVKAYQEEEFLLPFIGQLAKNYLNKI